MISMDDEIIIGVTHIITDSSIIEISDDEIMSNEDFMYEMGKTAFCKDELRW